MNPAEPNRATTVNRPLIAISISHEEQSLLARGYGIDHLKEMLQRLVRPLIRLGFDVAYGGNWQESPDNFTYEILRLIDAEKEDQSVTDTSNQTTVGKLFNHVSWPYYLDIDTKTEARWIHCCRIVRVSQDFAGIPDHQVVPDSDRSLNPDLTMLNAAITLSATRTVVSTGLCFNEGTPAELAIPRLSARIVLGGKTNGFSGFVPGIYEEVSLAIENQIPVYILGGFGGAATDIADALIAEAKDWKDAFSLDRIKQHTPHIDHLGQLAFKYEVPANIRQSADALDKLVEGIEHVRDPQAQSDGNSAGCEPGHLGCLRTGLEEGETRELLHTTDMRRAVQLVTKGIKSRLTNGTDIV